MYPAGRELASGCLAGAPAGRRRRCAVLTAALPAGSRAFPVAVSRVRGGLALVAWMSAGCAPGGDRGHDAAVESSQQRARAGPARTQVARVVEVETRRGGSGHGRAGAVAAAGPGGG